MSLPKELTTVTVVSRTVELIVLITAMIIGFGLGVNYQETIDLLKQQNNSVQATIIKPTTPTPIAIPTVDSSITANWKTYTHSFLKFQIKYPPNWDYIAVSEGEPLHLYFYPQHTKNIPPREKGDPLSPISLSVFAVNPDEELKCLSASLDLCADIKVDNIPAKRYLREPSSETVIFKKDNWSFGLLAYKFDQKLFYQGRYNRSYYKFYELPSDELKIIFDQILSTFKFTQ